jgi:hypothetical protein
VVSHAKEIGYKAVGIATNGTLLSQEGYLERLIAAGLDYLEFSLIHHDAETVSKLTGRSFTFARQLTALERLNQLPLSPHFFVLFNVVMNALNRNDLLAMARFVNERFPNFRRRFNFKSMVLRGNALVNEWIRTQFCRIRTHEVFSYLEEMKIPFWTENMPVCMAPGFEWHSLNVTTRVFDRKYKDIRFDKPEDYYDTGYHDTGKTQPSVCRPCTLRALCHGMEINYLHLYGTGEFKASRADPVAVIGRVLSEHGEDPARAAAIHDGLQRFYGLGPYEDRERTVLYFRQGEHRRAAIVVEPLGEEEGPRLRLSRFQLVFAGDGGSPRRPDREEQALLAALARPLRFLEKHHPEQVLPWCDELKRKFEDGKPFAGQWVLLPESRRMVYY